MSQLSTNLHIEGALSCRELAVPAGAVTNAAVAATAAVDASKLEHHKSLHFSDNFTTTAAAFRRVIYRVDGLTAVIISLKCGVTTACLGDSTITIQLKKNGTNILSSAIVLDSTNAARTVEAAVGYTSTSLVVGDVLEIDVTVAAGTGTLGLGLFGILKTREVAT